MTTEQWVARLRKIGDEMDEVAASIHPSGWNEQLAPLRAEWRRVAAMETDEERNDSDS